MSSQGVMSGKQTNNSPGLCPSKGQYLGPWPEINSRACLCALQGPRHNARCWFFIQHFIFFLIFCLETPKQGSGPINCWPELLLLSLSAISFPLTPAWPGTQYSLMACRADGYVLISGLWFQGQEGITASITDSIYNHKYFMYIIFTTYSCIWSQDPLPCDTN